MNVLIVGAGSIGSNMLLAIKNSPLWNDIEKIDVYDFDKIEEHNIGNQLYSLDFVGQDKVKALRNVIKYSSPGKNGEKKLNTFNRRFNGKIENYDIIIPAVDNMVTRYEIFTEWKEKGKKNSKYIDGRIGGLFLQYYFIKKCDAEKFEDHFSENETEDTDMNCQNRMSILSVLFIVSKAMKDLCIGPTDYSYREEICLKTGIHTSSLGGKETFFYGGTKWKLL